MKQFYTYLWLREDGTPYYVGKGSGIRAHASHRGHRPPKDKPKIVVQHWSDESTAFAYEIYLIDFWGRKDLGTGTLRNHSDGGENPPSSLGKKFPGRKPSEETKRKISESLKGKRNSLGKVLSIETRKKMSASRIGKPRSEETKRRVSEGLKGHTVSKETKEKLSRTAKEQWIRKRDGKLLP
jgi:hypothetical protein